MTTPRRPAVLGLALLAAGLAACQSGDGASESADAETGVVEVTAKDFEFEMPGEIPSGWTTMRFVNEGEQEHFFLLWRLPEGKSFADYRSQVAGTFLRVWSRYDSGDLTREETLEALGEELPGWFFTEAVPSGGAALTEGGRTSRVTLELEPGTYAVECYVKTPQGTWHTDRGMLRSLTVTGDATGTAPPEADAELVLSNYAIATEGRLAAGARTVAVRVTDTPDGFMAHDVNLFRLEEGTTVEEIVAWMDWMDLDGFRSPAPGQSLGGVESMEAGSTGYMTVELEPGRYAWVSEGYGARGMVSEFTVE